MSRDDGFRVVDHDPRFLNDLKIRRLRREAPDEGEGAIRTLVYIALRDSSWYDGERLVIEDADCPYEITAERIAALRSAGLISDNRITERAWGNWFLPAWGRRDKMRIAGREGNRRRWGHDDSGPDSPPDSGPESPPVSPSVRPSDRPPDGPVGPSVRPSAPSVQTLGQRVEKPNEPTPMNGRVTTTGRIQVNRTCPGCGDLLDDGDPNVVVTEQGRQLWHRACPPAVSA